MSIQSIVLVSFIIFGLIGFILFNERYEPKYTFINSIVF